MSKSSINRFLSKPSVAFALLASPFYFVRFFWFTLIRGSARYLRYYPGHFASLIPSGREIARNQERIFNKDIDELPGIDLRHDAQLSLLKEFKDFYSDFTFPVSPSEDFRYYTDNDYFRFYDGFVLFSMLRRFQPRRVIELGSGYSSALVLDVNDRYLDNALELTFVEPYPQRLYELLADTDRTRCQIFESNVQDVSLSVFSDLSEGDMLLIDTSHVFGVGGDLHTIFNQIISNLPKGVLIHIHDIFWPFEYPKDITMTGRLWNESYIARAFLQFNSAFEIVYWNDYVGDRYADVLRENFPLCAETRGASLWIRRCA